MDKGLEDFVRNRAGGRCEYCHFPQPPFHIEHITARKHGGTSSMENLALACIRCNFYKGSNLSGIDSQTGRIARLFHPRTDRWQQHFRWNRGNLKGKTPTGRATIAVLRINEPVRVTARIRLMNEGVFGH